MALEHLVIASDFQDWGTPGNNTAAIDNFTDFVTKNYDTANTHVHLNGDMLDWHVVSPGKYNPEQFQEQMVKEVDIQQVKDLVTKITTEKDNIPIEQAEQYALNILSMSQYAEKASESFSKLTKEGFNTTALVGNNEQRIVSGGRVNSDNAIQVSDYFREEFAKNTGIEFIDDNTIHSLSGYNVFSTPYVNDLEFSISTDIESTEEGSVYRQMNEVMNGETNALMLHGNLRENGDEAKGIKQYLAEYEGDTLWVFSGHRGKAGVEGTVNEKGSKIIYVNSNNHRGENGINQQIVYDAEINDGKIISITDYQMQWDEAA